MSSEPENQDMEDIIALVGDDGRSYNCQVVLTFSYDKNNYALLQNLGEMEAEEDDSEEGSLVVMRVSQAEDKVVFNTIETQDEFDRVSAHVQDIVQQAALEEEEA